MGARHGWLAGLGGPGRAGAAIDMAQIFVNASTRTYAISSPAYDEAGDDEFHL